MPGAANPGSELLQSTLARLDRAAEACDVASDFELVQSRARSHFELDEVEKGLEIYCAGR